MKKLTVYERAEELGSLILGLNVDPNRKRFDEMIPILEAYDIEVIRYNEVHHRNDIPKGTLLPTLNFNNDVLVTGRYPQVHEVSKWFDIPKEAFATVPRTGIFQEANSAYGGACCGIHDDYYVDPNET